MPPWWSSSTCSRLKLHIRDYWRLMYTICPGLVVIFLIAGNMFSWAALRSFSNPATFYRDVFSELEFNFHCLRSYHAVRWSIIVANDYKAVYVHWCFVLTWVFFLDHLFQTIVSWEFISSCVCFCTELQCSFIWLISTEFIHEALKKNVSKAFPHLSIVVSPFFVSSSIPPVKFKHLTCPLVCVSDWFFFLLFCHPPFFHQLSDNGLKTKPETAQIFCPGCVLPRPRPSLCSCCLFSLSPRRSQASCCWAFYWYTKQTFCSQLLGVSQGAIDWSDTSFTFAPAWQRAELQRFIWKSMFCLMSSVCFWDAEKAKNP